MIKMMVTWAYYPIWMKHIFTLEFLISLFICLFVCASFKTGKKLLRHLQTFCNLKRLELKIRGKDGDLAVLASLLYCSPVLKSLCITFHSDGDQFTKGKSRVILETI
ncbi:hypothetical protein WN943_001796 [Citrus x changshan-huyou]